MIVEIRQHCILTIDDFSIIRSKNIENAIFNILVNKFKGICYKKTYIIDIVKILKMSDFEFNQNDISNCSFNLEVLFVCKCEYFLPDEPVMDMKILNIKQNSITLGSNNKIAILKDFNSREVMGLKVGDILPVRAIKCIYEPCANKIKMGCLLLTVESKVNIINEEHKNTNFAINTKNNNIGHLLGISSYNEKLYKEDVFNELSNERRAKNTLISIDELLNNFIIQNDKEWIIFKINNTYCNNIEIIKETDGNISDECVEIDDGFLCGVLSRQYVLRNTINELSKDKIVLQKYYNMYNNK